MKIAMMTNNYKPFVAGVPISIERLSKGLRDNGHEVVVFAPNYKGQEMDENVVRYHALIKGVANGFSVPNSLDGEIERQFKAGGFDIIHVHHPMLIGWTAEYLSRKYHVPLCMTYHTRYEQYLHYIGAPFLRNLIPSYVNRFARDCDMIFAPTPSMQTYLEDICGRTRVVVLPTGIDKDSFLTDKEEIEKLRSDLLAGKQYLFCTVARLAKEKNLEFLLRALAGRKRKYGADFRFAIIGEGSYQKQLQSLAKELDILEEVVFVGKVPNEQVKNYCKAADLFLFSSLSETQGIVLLEAMAAATPVLALYASGVRDIVVNGRNGYMTRASEIEFNDRLEDLLKQDRTYLEQGALETAAKYETREIAKCAALYYNIAMQNYRQEERRFGSISYFNC
ncbi:MAG: glycosyltransferase [Blautia sp.]|nr:glycosyltransferase [Blautia sp.]